MALSVETVIRKRSYCFHRPQKTCSSEMVRPCPACEPAIQVIFVNMDVGFLAKQILNLTVIVQKERDRVASSRSHFTNAWMEHRQWCIFLWQARNREGLRADHDRHATLRQASSPPNPVCSAGLVVVRARQRRWR